MTALTTAALQTAISRLAATLEERHGELTELDGRIGDGDLGITLLKAFRALDGLRPELPDDLGQAFAKCAGEVTKVSSSSFGTLFATALMATAKTLKGRTEADLTEIAALITGALDAMAARGKASLGDKTVLDALDAIRAGAEGQSDPDQMLAEMRQRVARAVTDFTDKPNRVGRARIFGDKTVGIPDPGMTAVLVMIEGLQT